MRHAVSPSLLARGVTAAAAAALVVTAASPALAAEAEAGPKNVILLIGDGMGYNHIDSTSLYESGHTNWQVRTDAAGNPVHVPGSPTQIFETWDNVAMQTFAHGGSYDAARAWSDFDYVKDNPTDSAAAGTAMATGHKVVNGALGVTPDGARPENLTQRAQALGKAAGVVSSVPFSHATPASFVAANESRNNYQGIAETMIDSGIEVIMGAGHPEFNDSGERRDEASYGYIGEDSFRSLVDGQTQYDYLEEKTDFEALTTGETPEKVFGLAQVGSTLQQGREVAEIAGDDYTDPNNVAHEALPYQTPFNDNVPSLETMTKGALNVLDEDEDGFFVMIEGGAIDWTGHANETARNIEETEQFTASVKAAVAWVEENSNWDETQVIVTADHETGYLSGADSDPTLDAMRGAAGDRPEVGWYSGDHTNQLVPVFSRGAGTEELLSRVVGTDPVRGEYIDNTAIANYLLEGLWAIPATDDGDIPVQAEIPGVGSGGEPVPGSLVMSVEEGTAELANARNAGDRLRLSGVLPTVSVTDSRAQASGWSVTGQSSDLTAGSAVVRADRLGWAPFVEAGNASPGAPVATSLSGGPGLAAPATLGTGAGETRVGTADLAADMVLETPVDTVAGAYTGGVTVSLFPQD